MRQNLVDRDRLLRSIKEGSWVVVGQIAAMIGSLLLVRVLTSYLDAVQYGQLALGLTISGLIQQVLIGGVSNGIGRFYSIAVEKKDIFGYLNASFRLMGYASAAFVTIAVVLIAGLFRLGYSRWMGLAGAVLVFSLFESCNAVLNSMQNAARQRSVVALHRGLNALLKMPLAVGVMLWLGKTSTAAVIGYALSLLVVTISQLYFARQLIWLAHAGTPQTSVNWGQQMWRFSWPFSVWGIFTWCQMASGRWALQHFASIKDVGLYMVVFQLGYAPITLITSMMLSFFGPILYHRSGSATDSDRNRAVHRISWRISLAALSVTAIASILALLLHGPIFHLMVAAEYQAVSYLLPWTVLAGGMFAAGQMLSLKLMSEIKSSALIASKTTTAILGVGLNVYGAAQFGMLGTIAALVIFSGSYFVWMAWIARDASLLVK